MGMNGKKKALPMTEFPFVTVELAGTRYRAGIDGPWSKATLSTLGEPEMVVFDRLRNNSWRVRDVEIVVRAGLLGGALDGGEADAIMAGKVLNRPIGESAAAAMMILGAYLIGLEKEGA